MKEALLLLLQFSFGNNYEFEKPVAKTLWQENCKQNSYVLNDCNWCRCDMQHKFMCKARVCREVDMFGHFNDAIQSINVGMEGHGSWRSMELACEPGVHYRRDNLLCVCNEDGNWPNPTCRDIFRILHSIEITGVSTLSETVRCSPTKLYLIGCNICYCPSSGHIDPKMCTKHKCSEDDPLVIDNNKESKPEIDESTVDQLNTNNEIQDIYAECHHNLKYKMGCKTCICLRNNRLLCNNCTSQSNLTDGTENYCSNKKPNHMFHIDCNTCYCNENGLVVCTAKVCLIGPKKKKLEIILTEHPISDLEEIDAPIDDHECTPGTLYKKNCNLCKCIETNGVKIFGCTRKHCEREENALESINADCVKGSVYEMDCLYCRCDIVKGVKWQWCKVNPECSAQQDTPDTKQTDLSSLHGYCEPLHVYKKDCNTCRCLSNGKFMVCTSKYCDKRNPSEPLSIEIVPVTQKNGTRCPKQYSYKIDCNYCFCLSNGNALCTTAKCNKNDNQ